MAKRVKTISDVSPQRRNANRHNPRGMGQLESSIQADGWIGAITVAADGETFDGSARIEVAGMTGFEDAIVVESDGTRPLIHVRTDVPSADDPRAVRLGLAANRVAEMNLEWDTDVLAELSAEVDLSGLWSDDELAALLGVTKPVADDPGAQVDKAAELQERWGTVRGQLWQVGRHRLLCGDSTNADDVARLLDGTKPTLMVTDPPYGVEYDPAWRVEAGVQERSFNSGTVANDDQFDWSPVWRLSPSEVAYVWHASWFTHIVAPSLESAGFDLKYLIIWNKDLAVFGRGSYHWKHEPCWFVVRSGCTQHWVGDHKQTTVWDIPTIHSFENGHNADEWKLTGHGTQKPVECMARPIHNHAGDVYDPFVGSGTTIVAAEQEGRTAYAIDIEPKYIAVCLERLTGLGLDARRLD